MRISKNTTGHEANGVSVPVAVHETNEVISDPVHEENEQSMNLDETSNETMETSVSEGDEDSESAHEAEGVSKIEYLHEGDCQNVDNPLHELEFIQNDREMHSFHLAQEHLEHRQCTICKEAWPTRQNLASDQKYSFVTGVNETRNHPRNLVPRMTWTQEQFLNN